VKVKVQRDAPLSHRPWAVVRPEGCHDYCFRRLGTFHTWEQALRYAMAMAYGD
jgi:hypothetical protein